MTSMPNDEPTPGVGDCTGCELPPSRRRFLRDSFLSAAGALVAVGVSRTSAFAMPLDFIEGKRRAGHTVSYAITSADGAQIDKKNDVILVRWQGAVYAFDLSCPHQNTALHWSDGDHQFECPKHHSRFSRTATTSPTAAARRGTWIGLPSFAPVTPSPSILINSIKKTATPPSGRPPSSSFPNGPFRRCSRGRCRRRLSPSTARCSPGRRSAVGSSLRP